MQIKQLFANGLIFCCILWTFKIFIILTLIFLIRSYFSTSTHDFCEWETVFQPLQALKYGMLYTDTGNCSDIKRSGSVLFRCSFTIP
jgi:hypothetical protein